MASATIVAPAATGAGTGLKPPVFLRPSNHVRLGIKGLGEQEQLVRAWNGPA
jgi:hypothetical protein